MEQLKQEKRTSWIKAIGIGLGGACIVGLITLAFLWPSKVAEPREYPVAIAGNIPQLASVKEGIAKNAGSAIKLIDVADREEAVRKIKNREVFGALIMGMPRPEVLTASANGQAANAVTMSIATSLQEKLNNLPVNPSTSKATSTPKITLTTTDIVPAHSPKFDIAQLALPLALGGILGGVMISRLVRGRWLQLAALGVYSLVAGGTLYLIIQNWFDLLPAQFGLITSALSLGIFATASFIVGSYARFGMRGVAIAGAFTMLVANPLSGMAIPSLFLPEPWGVVGQWLTIGAAGTLLRTVTYFPSAEVLTPVVVLCAWSVMGVAGTLLKKR